MLLLLLGALTHPQGEAYTPNAATRSRGRSARGAGRRSNYCPAASRTKLSQSFQILVNRQLDPRADSGAITGLFAGENHDERRQLDTAKKPGSTATYVPCIDSMNLSIQLLAPPENRL